MQSRSNQAPYSADQLETLSRVLRESLAATLANVLQRSDEAIEELTSRLGKVIIDQFATGESDPELLKVIAVNSIRGRAGNFIPHRN